MSTINLEKIKNEIDILSLARDLGLQIGQRNARCYNAEQHNRNDKNYSLAFDKRRNRYKCFACDVSGSTIDLYAAIHQISPKEAIQALWQNYFGGNGKPMKSDFAYRQAVDKEELDIKRLEQQSVPGRFSDIYEAFSKFCGPPTYNDMAYLIGPTRGLTHEIIEKFKLFSIKDYQATNDFLKGGWSLEDLRMSGLYGESGNLIFYKHPIIIPFYHNGRIVFLQGRKNSNIDQSQPKYLMLSDVEVPLFNMDTLTGTFEKIYLCEGVFDAMIMEQQDCKALAVLGVNNFTDKHCEWLKQFNCPIKVLFDNDEAGKTASLKVVDNLSGKGVDTTAPALPSRFKDITEYYLYKRTLQRA